MNKNVSQATAQASEAAKAFDAIAAGTEPTKVRKNFLYVFVKFNDGTCDISHGLRGQMEANAWLAEREKAVEEVRVFFGHERKAKRQTRLAFF